MSLDTRQFKALKGLAEDFGMTVLTPPGNFNEKFVRLCKDLVEFLGYTFVSARGTYVTRKGLALYQVAKAIGMSTHASTTMRGLLLESAHFIYDQSNDGTPIDLGTFEQRVVQYLFHSVGQGDVELIQWLSSADFPSNDAVDQLVGDVPAVYRDSPCLVLDTVDKVFVDGKSPTDLGAYTLDATVDLTVKAWVNPDDASKRLILGPSPIDVQGFGLGFLNGNVFLERSGVNQIVSTGNEFSVDAGVRLDWVQATNTFSLYVLSRSEYVQNQVGTLIGTYVSGWSGPEGTEMFNGHGSLFDQYPYKGMVADLEIINGQRSLHWTCDQRARKTLLDSSTEGPNYLGVLQLVSGEDVAWGSDQNGIHHFEKNGGSRIVDFGLQSNPGYCILEDTFIGDGQGLEIYMKWGGGDWGSVDGVGRGIRFVDTMTPTSGGLAIQVGNPGQEKDISEAYGEWVGLRFDNGSNVWIDRMDGAGWVSLGFTTGNLVGFEQWMCLGRLKENEVLGESANLEIKSCRLYTTGTYATVAGFYGATAYDNRRTADAGITGVFLDSEGLRSSDIIDSKFSFYPVQDISSDLVLNGGFENGFDDWDDGVGGNRSAAIVTDDPHSGTNCMRIQQGIPAGTGTVDQVVPLIPDTDYEISVWMKSNTPAGSIVFDTKDDFDDVAQWTQGGTQGWTYYSAIINSGPLNEVTLRCFCNNTMTLEGWFDDIKVVPVDGGNIVKNASFEDGDNTPIYWTESPPSANVKRVDVESHTGDWSEMLKGDGNNSSAAILYQDTELIPNTYYEMSLWVYSNRTGGSAIIDTNDKFDATCQWVINFNQPSWQQLKGRFFSGAETSMRVRLIRGLSLNGEVYIDDVIVRPVMTSPVGVNEVTNPAVVGTALLNNGPAKIKERDSNTQFLVSPFWSPNGTDYSDGKVTWGECWEHISNTNSVWLLWQKISEFCMVSGIITTQTPSNLATFDYLTGLQAGAECGSNTAPYNHTGDGSGNALGDGDGNILS